MFGKGGRKRSSADRNEYRVGIRLPSTIIRWTRKKKASRHGEGRGVEVWKKESGSAEGNGELKRSSPKKKKSTWQDREKRDKNS